MTSVQVGYASLTKIIWRSATFYNKILIRKSQMKNLRWIQNNHDDTGYGRSTVVFCASGTVMRGNNFLKGKKGR